MQLIFLFLCLNAWGVSDGSLAQRYAPTIIQELGNNPVADEFTLFNFDQDWNPNNNWANLEKFPRPRAAYYSVIESENYYFLTYSLFFPRDYADTCFWVHCHENDFEGFRLTIEKPDKLIRLETLVHNFLTIIENPLATTLVIEAGGHGVHALQSKTPHERHKIYTPADYQLHPLIEIWQRRHQGLFSGQFEFEGRSYPSQFDGQEWILWGLGRAKPPWAWETWNAPFKKGEWFLKPLTDKTEKYLLHPYLNPTSN